MAMNSAPSKIKIPAELKKAKIKNKTLLTGFFDVTTRKADNSKIIENK